MHPRLYRRYVTSLLLLVYVFNQLDRLVFSILMEPIKRAFGLTDTQLGLLVGPALVILYSCLGVPVARWADRWRRIPIMTVAIALWSLFATLTAAATQFWQLALARVGVGVGEAGFSAVAISLICDYEERENRARAIAFFMLAIPIGGLISDLMGGWVNELYGWRWAFVIAGAPGLFLAILLWTTVREPLRGPRTAVDDLGQQPRLRAVLAQLWQLKSLRYVVIGLGINTIFCWVMGWVSVYFIRQYRMTTGELGSWFAASDIGTFMGIWLGGRLAARLGANNPRATLRSMAVSGVLALPLAQFVLWCPSKYAALLGYGVLTIAIYFSWGPATSLVQELAGPAMRATAASVLILTQTLSGGLIGAPIVGLLSDVLTPHVGDTTVALRWAMTLGSTVTLLSALYFWRAARASATPSLSRALRHAPSSSAPHSNDR